MKKLTQIVVASLLGTLVGASSLPAQARLFVDPPVTPAQAELKAAVLVLRDTLYDVDAVAARLIRANAAGTRAVAISAARELQGNCVRSVRAAGVMRTHMGAFSTPDPRGKRVLAGYRKALEALTHAMQSCDQLAGANVTAATPDVQKLAVTASSASQAVRQYENEVVGLMKTLQIPYDPKGHQSAITL